MNRWRPVFAALLFVLPAVARAEGTITLPLSGDFLLSPRLETARLTPKTRESVRTALAAAARASRAASAAESIIGAAMAAAGKAGKVRGYDRLDVPGVDGTACLYQGRATQGRATGLGVMHCRQQIFAGRFRDGRLNGLGGDAALNTADAYEGEYRNGARMGFGVERDKDGSYPGLYGFRANAGGQKSNMEVLGLQDFKDAHWAGHYGVYGGPRIACTLIKGAVLEGSVLDGYGAKFDSGGHLIEQGFYKSGMLENGSGPPC
ncbi:MAG TPA: hypothetical protein VH019_01200 [Rhizomicrobium sp.]|nr:hypothetical protein [Rhizomicrobium sp.]